MNELQKFEGELNAVVSERVAQMLPSHINPATFAAVVMTRRNNRVLAQWVPMIRGVLKRARELGDLTAINAYVVYKKDVFEIALGDDAKIIHKPSIDKDRGEIVAAYAIFKKGDEVIHREIMTREEIERTRSVSRAATGGAWKDWFAEMARKTVIRRGSKSVPMSQALSQIIQHEDRYVDFTLRPEPEPVKVNPLDDDFSQERQSTLEERLRAALESAQDLSSVRSVLTAFQGEVLQLIDEDERAACRALAEKHLRRVVKVA